MAKIRVIIGSTVVLLLAVTTALWLLPNQITATPIGTLPIFVVKDGNGNVVGPVIGIDVNGRPLVAYDGDAATGRRAFLSFDQAGFVGEHFQVFYSGLNCTGTAYVRAASSLFGVKQMTGITYAVGLGTSNHIWLYRSNSSGPGSTPAVQSVYSSTGTADFSDGSKCLNDNSGSSNLVTATAAIDVTQNFPPNYTLE